MGDRSEASRHRVEASPLAIIALDGEGRVKMWNRGAERIFGWTEDEVIGRPLPTIPPVLSGVPKPNPLSNAGPRQTLRLRKDSHAQGGGRYERIRPFWCVAQ